MSKPVTMLVTYYPATGKEQELLELVKKHWPVIRAAGLATESPAEIWEASDKRSGEIYFVEKFQWKSEESSEKAHRTPEVMAVWEPMEEVMDNIVLASLEKI